MKIIDRYIIKKYLGTLGFMLALLSIIVVIIDVQSKAPRIEGNGFTVGYFLIHFYPFWVVYLVITFMSILVFVSIIFFTSPFFTGSMGCFVKSATVQPQLLNAC